VGPLKFYLLHQVKAPLANLLGLVVVVPLHLLELTAFFQAKMVGHLAVEVLAVIVGPEVMVVGVAVVALALLGLKL